MNKTIISLLVTATATAVACYVVKKTTEKKYASVSTPKHPDVETDEETESPAQTSLKERAIAKVEDILANGAIFVLDHEKEFKAAGIVLSSISAAFEIALAIWGYKILKKPKELTGEDIELIKDHDRSVVSDFLTKLASRERSSFTNRKLGKRIVCTVEPLEV